MTCAARLPTKRTHPTSGFHDGHAPDHRCQHGRTCDIAKVALARRLCLSAESSQEAIFRQVVRRYSLRLGVSEDLVDPLLEKRLLQDSV